MQNWEWEADDCGTSRNLESRLVIMRMLAWLPPNSRQIRNNIYINFKASLMS
jgi:hypothetical protein